MCFPIAAAALHVPELNVPATIVSPYKNAIVKLSVRPVTLHKLMRSLASTQVCMRCSLFRSESNRLRSHPVMVLIYVPRIPMERSPNLEDTVL